MALIRPSECLQMAVDALGSAKDIGHKMRPELDPIRAGKWLNRSLSDEHAQRLDYDQERLLYRIACEAGEHEGFRAYAESIGYRIEPINAQAEIAALAARAQKLAEQSSALSAEVMARMAASHVNTDVLK